jgi:hypothetical protein
MVFIAATVVWAVAVTWTITLVAPTIGGVACMAYAKSMACMAYATSMACLAYAKSIMDGPVSQLVAISISIATQPRFLARCAHTILSSRGRSYRIMCVVGLMVLTFPLQVGAVGPGECIMPRSCVHAGRPRAHELQAPIDN